MFIKKRRILKVDFAEEYIKDNRIHIGVPADVENIKKVGLDTKNGANSVLPSPLLGINSRRNADGEWRVDKNAPKEMRVIRTIEWTWQQWVPGGGTEEHSDWRDIVKECYPKRFISPHNVEVQLATCNKSSFLTSEILVSNYEKEKPLIKNTINMYLEIFGFCYIYDEDYKFDIHKIKHCQWEFLPPGDRIWAKGNLEKEAMTKNENSDKFFQHRLDTLHSYSPKEVYQGKNGFCGYFAFIFGDFCIMENGKYGNATYVIKSANWEVLSQMTKAQLFDTKSVIKRFVHHAEWNKKMDAFMNEIN